MIPELGHFALIVALLVAIAQGTLPLIGAHRRDAALMAFARPAAIAQFLLVAFAFGCLAYSFATGDFSVETVAQHSNSQLPLPYQLAATWGSHEGSLLLWVLMLTGWALAVALRSQSLPAPMLARVLAVMGLISIGFLVFLLFTSNPFLRLNPPAPDGSDLNPLLQDPGMVIHPPMLYMGYVGFSVAFAFAIAALLGGRLDATWRAGRGRGRSPRGRSSPSASRSAAGGRTTSSAGAAGGSGIRSRTRRSCRGSSAPRCCTRWRSPRSAARSRAGPCSSRSSRSRCRCSGRSSCARAC